MSTPPSPAARAIEGLAALELTVATAESLTGGLVCASLTSVPGASSVVRGGVVAYATQIKRDVLGVDADLLEHVGPVHPDVAAAMAVGAARLLGAGVGVATTGVAGPGPHDGHPAGTVFVSVALPADDAGAAAGGTVVRGLALTGDRDEVRRAASAAAVGLLAELLAGCAERPGPPPPQ